jgi:methyl-accepting chemotaxis protein
MPRKAELKQGGVVYVILPLVILFALVAVVELTRTLEAAQEIDARVSAITGSVSGANKNLNTGCEVGQSCSSALPVLTKTESIVAQINDAAKPLAGETGNIVTVVNSINTTASQILAAATSINGTVHSINTVAGSINSSVVGIGGSVSGINASVAAINGGVSGINNRADVVITLVSAIKGDTGKIGGQAGAILTQALGISCDKVLGLLGPLSTTC